MLNLYTVGDNEMYERMINKNEIPTMEEFIAHIGKRKESFESIDEFLTNELDSEKMIKFDGHSQCWDIVYRKKENIYAI